MFIKNKYTSWYFSIIEQSKQRSIDGYFETHHIIPKSLGGDNDPSNLVTLTAREHFICHLLLVKMVSNERDKAKMALSAAWFKKHPELVTNRIYESLRTIIADSHRKAYTGTKQSFETRLKKTLKQKQIWESYTPEQRAERIAKRRAPCSESTKSKIGSINSEVWIKKKQTGDMPIVDDAYRAKKRAAANARWAKHRSQPLPE
jgi:hypothetical protein